MEQQQLPTTRLKRRSRFAISMVNRNGTMMDIIINKYAHYITTTICQRNLYYLH